MKTNPIKPELSKKNDYWIDRHRYYELRHFCAQYSNWSRALKDLSYIKARQENESGVISKLGINDPTPDIAEQAAYYKDRINMVEQSCIEADSGLAEYLFFGLTCEGATYEYMKMRKNIPCSRNTYYKYLRKALWILDQKRK